MPSTRLFLSALAVLSFVSAGPAAAAPPAPPGLAPPSAEPSRAVTPVRHLWPGHRVCRRLRLRGWRYGIWESRAAWRLHCRQRARRISARQCQRLRIRGWRWGEPRARARYRRLCR